MSSDRSSASASVGHVQEAGLQQIGQMIASHRANRAMTTAAQLGVFDALESGERTAAGVAEVIQADARRIEVLLDALASVGLLRKQCEQDAEAPATYANTDTGQRYLVSDSPDSLSSNLCYQEKLAPAWAALPQVVRTGQPYASLIELIEQDPEFTEHYIRGMSEIAKPSARDLMGQLDLTHCRRALDVGGGPGTYAAALAQANPAMEVDLLDLPPALKVAEATLAEAPGGDRVRLRAGDYLEASYGTEEYDFVLLSHVTHDEGEPENLAMLQRAHRALRSRGTLVIHDFMVDAARTRPAFGALFSLHLSIYTQKGRTYSSDEYKEWMQRCGFEGLSQLAVCADRPNATAAIIGTKP